MYSVISMKIFGKFGQILMRNNGKCTTMFNVVIASDEGK